MIYTLSIIKDDPASESIVIRDDWFCLHNLEFSSLSTQEIVCLHHLSRTKLDGILLLTNAIVIADDEVGKRVASFFFENDIQKSCSLAAAEDNTRGEVYCPSVYMLGI